MKLHLNSVHLACVAVVTTACGSSSKPPATSAPQPVPPAPTIEQPPVVTTAPAAPAELVPRPIIDVELVPDLRAELRWPLSAMTHPELAPRLDIASVFADAGIGWIELCERGVHRRTMAGRNRDELEYLRGWCSALAGDADAACEKLAPLRGSTVRGLAAAVRIDLANIIATAGNADRADHLINKHRIDGIEIFDLLAATYVELGKERDAYEMNKYVLANDVEPSAAVQCRRLIKDIALGGDRSERLAELAALANRSGSDPTCLQLQHKAACTFGGPSKCQDYLADAGIDPAYAGVVDAYRAWPGYVTAHNVEAWLRVVRAATGAPRVPAARNLATIALETARRFAPDCSAAVVNATYDYFVAWPDATHLRDELRRCRFPDF